MYTGKGKYDILTLTIDKFYVHIVCITRNISKFSYTTMKHILGLDIL